MTEPLTAHPTLSPYVLSANTPGDRPYRGGEGIARFRGIELPDEWRPEDFVGSTTEVFSGHGVGLSRLPDGTLLRDAIEQDPVGWLGEEHVRRWGADTKLLVKLLDTRERLFVHFHPGSEFSAERLGRSSGKTEAWIITSVEVTGEVWLGFSRDVSEVEVEKWFEDQDSAAMLAAMNRISVAPGDTIFVPASTSHAIGPGITLVELQQPTDLSIILEWKGYNGLTQESAMLGLGVRGAMEALDREALSSEDVEVLRSSRTSLHGRQLFPAAADDYFGAELIAVAGPVGLEAGFEILIVLDGSGTLRGGGEDLPLFAGMTVLVPHGFGEHEVDGAMTLIRACPPRL